MANEVMGTNGKEAFVAKDAQEERARIFGSYTNNEGESTLPTPDKNLIPVDKMAEEDQKRLAEIRAQIAAFPSDNGEESSPKTEESDVAAEGASESEVNELRQIAETVDERDTQFGRLDEVYREIELGDKTVAALISVQQKLTQHISELEAIEAEAASYGEGWMEEPVNEAYYDFARKLDEIIREHSK